MAIVLEICKVLVGLFARFIAWYHPHPKTHMTYKQRVFGNDLKSYNALHDRNSSSQIFVFHVIELGQN